MADPDFMWRLRGRQAFRGGADPYDCLPYVGEGSEEKNAEFVRGWRELEAKIERMRADPEDPKEKLLDRLRLLATETDIAGFVEELENRNEQAGMRP